MVANQKVQGSHCTSTCSAMQTALQLGCQRAHTLNQAWKVRVWVAERPLRLLMQAEKDDDAAIAAAAMAVLRQVHGVGIPEPTAVHVSRWGSDPYSLGNTLWTDCWEAAVPVHGIVITSALQARLVIGLAARS